VLVSRALLLAMGQLVQWWPQGQCCISLQGKALWGCSGQGEEEPAGDDLPSSRQLRMQRWQSTAEAEPEAARRLTRWIR